jgi:hypothetical protein
MIEFPTMGHQPNIVFETPGFEPTDTGIAYKDLIDKFLNTPFGASEDEYRKEIHKQLTIHKAKDRTTNSDVEIECMPQ